MYAPGVHGDWWMWGGGIVVVVICGTRRITQCEMNDQNGNSLCNVLKAYIINTKIFFLWNRDELVRVWIWLGSEVLLMHMIKLWSKAFSVGLCIEEQVSLKFWQNQKMIPNPKPQEKTKKKTATARVSAAKEISVDTSEEFLMMSLYSWLALHSLRDWSCPSHQ